MTTVDEYDHRNRLVKVVSKTSTGAVTKTVEYAYDHENRLVKKAVTQSSTTTETFFAYDNSQIALTMDDEGDVEHRLLWGLAVDQVLADELTVPGYPNETYWHLTDHQGSVRDIVAYDASEDETILSSHHRYNSFGLDPGEENMSTLHIGFTGKPFDPETGLQWNQHAGSVGRWYNPTIGRWMSQDPIGFDAGDANLYRYVGNSSTNKNDPTGLLDPIGKPGYPAPAPAPTPTPSPWPGLGRWIIRICPLLIVKKLPDELTKRDCSCMCLRQNGGGPYPVGRMSRASCKSLPFVKPEYKHCFCKGDP